MSASLGAVPSVQYFAASSLDGYIADGDESLDWLTGFDGHTDVEADGPVLEAIDTFVAGIGALVMGSNTYEWLLRAGVSKWPYADRPSWVFTSRGELDPIAGADLRFVSGDVETHADEMLASAGDRDFWVVGGGALAQSFAEAGRLDEVHLTVVPVVLGSGIPLFADRLADRLRLTGVRPFTNGMVELRYDVLRA